MSGNNPKQRLRVNHFTLLVVEPKVNGNCSRVAFRWLWIEKRETPLYGSVSLQAQSQLNKSEYYTKAKLQNEDSTKILERNMLYKDIVCSRER